MTGLKEWFADKYKTSGDVVDSITHQIGYVESKNVPTAVQKASGGGEGPGRGLFQFEKSTGGGSGAFQTALNRTENLYRKIGQDVPDWLAGARSSDDASQLTSSQQQEILLGDLAMKSGSDKLITEAIATGSAKSLWLQKHWAGAEVGSQEYFKKGEQWDREMTTYKPLPSPQKKSIDPAGIAMEAMSKIDKPLGY